ncbi:MAG: CotH kinase family protein [Cyclobacteriaceae bacterium]
MASKISLISVVLIISLSVGIKAQGLSSSNLPIVIINTDNFSSVPNEPKIGATMKIISRPDGSRNFLTDQDTPEFLNYNGRIGIEVRGSSSSVLPKKPYGLETRLADNKTANNVSILGMPAENDWVLNALAFDASLLRDHLSYELFRDMGHYAARSRYCEVILNGSYQGLYLFMEKLKGDDDRINIHEMNNTDLSGIDLTGGYIIKADKDNGDPVSWTMPGPASTAAFIHHEPEPEDITSGQRNFIMDQFMRLRDLAENKNESIQSGYPNIIDVPSFIDFMIINEVSANVDGYQFSTYFHKDKGGKLKAGPVWDFNLTYGNDLFMWGFNRSFTYTWQFDNGDNTGPFFWKRLYSSPVFNCYLTRRWKELIAEGAALNRNRINQKIDEIVVLTSEAAEREQQLWGTVSDRAGNIAAMKTWLQERFNWMNNQLSSFSACASPVLPQLVISAIHYNPAGDQTGDLEFIEITNAGQSAVSTAGFYFREPGMSYNFPPSGSISPGQKIYLASDAQMFEKFYSIKPFGDFVRNLNNGTHDLVLADAFGNIIDRVKYSDSGEWPQAADGAGAFLKLKDVSLDNSLADSWTASTECFFTVGKPVVNNIGLCENDNATQLSATTFPGTELVWYSVDSGTTPLSGAPVPVTSAASVTKYYVATRTAAGCESEKAEIIVTVSPKPTALQVTTDLSNPAAPRLEASSASGYQWYLYGIQIPGATEQIYTPYQDGSYQVAGTMAGCIGSLSLPVDLVITSLPDAAEDYRPKLFPNPAREEVTIRFPDSSVNGFEYDILDVTGKRHVSGITTSSETVVQLSLLSPGAFIVIVRQNQRTYSLKLIRGF